jgi:hypothetical protein
MHQCLRKRDEVAQFDVAPWAFPCELRSGNDWYAGIQQNEQSNEAAHEQPERHLLEKSKGLHFVLKTTCNRLNGGAWCRVAH